MSAHSSLVPTCNLHYVESGRRTDWVMEQHLLLALSALKPSLYSVYAMKGVAGPLHMGDIESIRVVQQFPCYKTALKTKATFHIWLYFFNHHDRKYSSWKSHPVVVSLFLCMRPPLSILSLPGGTARPEIKVVYSSWKSCKVYQQGLGPAPDQCKKLSRPAPPALFSKVPCLVSLDTGSSDIQLADCVITELWTGLAGSICRR